MLIAAKVMIVINSIVCRLHGVTMQIKSNLNMEAKPSSRNAGNYIQDYSCHYPEDHILCFMEFNKYGARSKPL
jgi:hypothetical protein